MPTTEAGPFVSVLMPVRNEGAFIERSLGAVLAQSYAAERLEILVIDGMSDDDTRQRVQRMAAPGKLPRVRILDNPQRIAPTALNVGLRAAQGEIVVRIDGHCEVAEDYVANGVAHLLAGVADGVGGVLDTVATSTSGQAIAVAMSSRFGVGGSAFRSAATPTEPIEVDTVAFPAYTRQAIERAGAFDEELVRNQDDEYNYRLRHLGGHIALVPGMQATYYSRATVRSLARQYFQYGLYKVRVLQKHPLQMKLRQFAPAAFVGALAATAAGAPFDTRATVALVTLLGGYLGACLVASSLAGSRHRLRVRARLPLVFATLHLSYGAGFLAGLARFAHRWGDRRGKLPCLVLGAEANEPERRSDDN